MTPKEKAKELVEKFLPYVDYRGDEMFSEVEKMQIMAQQCASMLVVEVLNILFQHHEIDYWKEVKQEIQKI